MYPDGGFERSIMRVLRAAWRGEAAQRAEFRDTRPASPGRAQGTPLKVAWRVKPSERTGRPEPLRAPAGIARTRDAANAEMHRESARAVMQAHHQGTL